MKVGRDIFFSLPYTLKFIFNELDIQCKGQKEMLVKINIKDVFLGGYVEQTRKHYEFDGTRLINWNVTSEVENLLLASHNILMDHF
ncbi:hypothetical protein NC653_003066 [Populus alba x Populus x berolinensis]|uniref:Uncharacterized protein n=1 Tax=Populus alba x Populus x berolinensis TaxID=444605 RepID=A0AAD6WIP4_9ROSI|nr:hypothetical protein NC653_003066 [Populus alba x Populus x berolinensis]